MFVDADAHIDECDETWSYFPKHLAELRPREMVFQSSGEDSYQGRNRRGLFIDGEVFLRRTRDDVLTQTTVEQRELYDVAARLRHMDEINMEIQVIYPSTLLEEVTRRPELEIAVCESYNRWLADRCGESNGRLQWLATLPLRSIPDALREMRRVKEAGAVGIFKRGFETDERRAGDPYFFPLYELAQELDLPIGIHISSPYASHTPTLTQLQPGISRALYVQDAFLSLLMGGVCTKFPRLRVGFVEAGCGWVPYSIWVAKFDTLSSRTKEERFAVRDSYAEILSSNRLFVTCEAIENLPDIIERVGDDNLCLGTDYAHSDRASLLFAHSEVAEHAGLSSASIRKLTSDNARAFYGLGPATVSV